MKHVMYGQKSLLMGDDVADRLLEYAGLLADGGHADAVTIKAIGPDGNEVDVTVLLYTGATLSAETTTNALAAPTNEVLISYLDARIGAIRRPPTVQFEDEDSEPTLPDGFLP